MFRISRSREIVAGERRRLGRNGRAALSPQTGNMAGQWRVAERSRPPAGSMATTNRQPPKRRWICRAGTRARGADHEKPPQTYRDSEAPGRRSKGCPYCGHPWRRAQIRAPKSWASQGNYRARKAGAGDKYTCHGHGLRLADAGEGQGSRRDAGPLSPVLRADAGIVGTTGNGHQLPDPKADHRRGREGRPQVRGQGRQARRRTLAKALGCVLPRKLVPRGSPRRTCRQRSGQNGRADDWQLHGGQARAARDIRARPGRRHHGVGPGLR